jgi:hypothetical protein
MAMYNQEQFIAYCLDFYGPQGIYPLGFTRRQLELATELYQLKLKQGREQFEGDTVDRENVRDLLLELQGA